MLFFDGAGRLAYSHGCEGCEEYPLENKDEPCLFCSYSQNDIAVIIRKVEAMNNAYASHGEGYEKYSRDRSRSAFLHITNISLGGDLDTITLTDIDMNNDIRELADLTEHMVELIIKPTDIVHKNLYHDDDDDDDDEYWEEEEDE